uniref:Uncharacterized protein n=1 Tax=Rhizophora mucronata TaxID=61149 RepID=A0A2P2NGY0_RHIMU
MRCVTSEKMIKRVREWVFKRRKQRAGYYFNKNTKKEVSWA